MTQTLNWIAVAATILLLAGFAGAQTSRDKQPELGQEWSAHPSATCKEYRIRHLYQATDTAQSLEDQQQHLLAAEAYGLLYSEGQSC